VCRDDPALRWAGVPAAVGLDDIRGREIRQQRRSHGAASVSGLEMSQNSMRLSWTREAAEQFRFTILVRIGYPPGDPHALRTIPVR